MTQLKIEKSKGEETDVIFCLSSDQLILLSIDEMKIQETIKYNNMEKIHYHTHSRPSHKINSKLSLYLIKESEEYKSKEIKFITDDRPMVIKNILCFYSVYFLYFENLVRHLATKIIKHKEEELPKGSSSSKASSDTSYKFQTLDSYCFFLNYNVKPLADKQTFLVKTTQNNIKEFKINVTISNIFSMKVFEVEKDMRDLSAFAYEEAYKYMLANTKQNSEIFKLMKNSLYIKKNNFNEDTSVWEGWTIRFRKCTLNKSQINNKNNNNKNFAVINYAFIFLRRKFLFPYFDTFRNFSLILEEESRESDFDLSKEATDILELAGDSLATTFKYPEKFTSVLKAKLNALLLDEETLLYYFNNLKINEVEIIWIGYAFVFFILTVVLVQDKNERRSPNLAEWLHLLNNCWVRIKHGFNSDNNHNKIEEL